MRVRRCRAGALVAASDLWPTSRPTKPHLSASSCALPWSASGSGRDRPKRPARPPLPGGPRRRRGRTLRMDDAEGAKRVPTSETDSTTASLGPTAGDGPTCGSLAGPWTSWPCWPCWTMRRSSTRCQEPTCGAGTCNLGTGGRAERVARVTRSVRDHSCGRALSTKSGRTSILRSSLRRSKPSRTALDSSDHIRLISLLALLCAFGIPFPPSPSSSHLGCARTASGTTNSRPSALAREMLRSVSER